MDAPACRGASRQASSQEAGRGHPEELDVSPGEPAELALRRRPAAELAGRFDPKLSRTRSERVASGLRPLSVYAGYRAAAALCCVLPEPIARRTGAIAGWIWSLLSDERRRLVEGHLRRVLGEACPEDLLRRRAAKAFVSYGRYWVESFRLPREPVGLFEQRIELEGQEHLEGAVALGKGVVIAAPHLGSWDYGGAWLATRGWRPVVAVERVEPPQLFEWFRRLRQGLGMSVVAMGSGATTALALALREGRVLALLSDRDIGGRGVEVEFFGERTRLPGGPALLALRTGATLLAVAAYDADDRGIRRIVARPPLALPTSGSLSERVADLTQSIAAELESLIRRAPEQWHLFVPNWPSEQGA
jgi:phosphatidylinositol dimannoside acyltransferase